MGAVVVALLVLLTACGTTKVQPGYYRVQSGDTLTQIARKQGTSVSNLVRWNSLSNSNSIEVGQMLRVAPPGGRPARPPPARRSQTRRVVAADVLVDEAAHRAAGRDLAGVAGPGQGHARL